MVRKPRVLFAVVVAAVKFTNRDIFGMDELIIQDGATETVKVLPKAPAGKYTFPIRCEGTRETVPRRSTS